MKRGVIKKITRRKKKTALRDFELCSRFQSGDFAIFPELADNYSSLIRTIMLKYEKQGLPNEELMLHAKIGLLKAAHRFDESKMVSFRLYAIWWMRQTVLKALNEHARITQVPEMLVTNLNELLHTFTRRSAVFPDSESNEEIQKAAGYKIRRVLTLKNLNKNNGQ